MSIYDEIGIPRVINAAGSMTYLGGSLIAPEVLEAMKSAAGSFVFIEDLLAWASKEIAAQTSADAGLVTTGTTGGLVLATAACLTGMDRQRMRQLPAVDGGKNKVIMQKQHRISFDHAVRLAGGQIVEVGSKEKTQAADIAEAIDDCTAAILHVVLDPQPSVPLAEVVEIAHARDVPVIVDAAAELPPVSNLHAFIEQGADLVVFSGGKAISGPNDTGILCGRQELIEAATAQAFPNAGIGRALKVSKEQIVGLVYALRRFSQIDFEAEMRHWQELAQRMSDGLQGLECAQAEVALSTRGARPTIIPRVRVVVDVEKLGKSFAQIDTELERGQPAMAITMQPRQNELWLSPQHLQEGEEAIAAARLRQVLTP
jgi:D-glucosaminate-6-phosphate ammonia-lyase